MTTALGRKRCRELASGYPDYYQLSSGRKLPIDYSTEPPSLSARIQDFYGLDQQPCLGKNRLPLQLILLSPAQRPVQITSDLPCFWRHNWELVRKEMRGRYPKHHWPEHPESAEPESRRK